MQWEFLVLKVEIHLELNSITYKLGLKKQNAPEYEKTYEMVVHGVTSVTLPEPIPSVERKTWLKILGVALQDNPCNWDLYFEETLKKASGRMYIIRVCKHYGLSSLEQLDLLFDGLIMSIFTFAIELWAQRRYIQRATSYPGSFTYARRSGKDPGWSWSREPPDFRAKSN